MLSAWRVTLKLYRFEMAVAVVAAMAVGVWALSVAARLDALNVPGSCITEWLSRVDGPDGAGECARPMLAWGSVLYEGRGVIAGEGLVPLSAMGVLPFAIGLLCGAPIVAREFEGRTAQTAWSLEGSRTLWLGRQAGPVALVLGAAAAFAAFGAATIAAADIEWGYPPVDYIGLHGPLSVVRAFAAFGLGLVVGALLGRTLPAVVLGAVLCGGLVWATGSLRDTWLANLDPVPIAHISEPTGEYSVEPGTISTGWAWITPDGGQLTNDEGLALVPADVAATDPEEEPVHSMEWLEEHGYQLLPVGVTDEMALGWAPYDGLIFGLVGVASLAATLVVVNRRSPS
jgi:hypothetical protein